MPMVLNIPGAILTPMPYHVVARCEETGEELTGLIVRDKREALRCVRQLRKRLLKYTSLHIEHIKKDGSVEAVE